MPQQLDQLQRIQCPSPRCIISTDDQDPTYSVYACLYCTHCSQLRCLNNCSLQQVVSYFCPNCLFEVASSTSHAERATCSRNCFQCPCCTALLNITTQLDDTLTLSCTACGWDSYAALGMKLDKPVGVAAQVSKWTQHLMPSNKDFASAREFMQQLANNDALVQARLQSKPRVYDDPVAPIYTPSEEYGAIIEKADWKAAEMQELMNFAQLTTTESIPRLSQRLNQWPTTLTQKVYSALPQRMKLRAKWLYRCVECQHIMSKPDTKAQSIKYKIRTLAIEHVPMVFIEAQTDTMLAIRIVNPIDAEVYIVVTAGNDADNVLINENIPANPHPLDAYVQPEEKLQVSMLISGSVKSSLVNAIRKVVTLDKQVKMLRVKWEYRKTTRDKTSSDNNAVEGETIISDSICVSLNSV